MSNNLFRQYYVRLRREAIFKSLLWGAAIGFLAAFAAALVTWLTYFSARFFVTVGVFAVVMAAATLICYFCFFRSDLQGRGKEGGCARTGRTHDHYARA